MALFEKDYAEEVAELEKLSLKVVNGEGVLRNNRQSDAIDCLALTRDAVRRIDTRYKELVAPLAASIEPYSTERKHYQAALEKVEATTKGALLAELKEAGELPEESTSGVRLSIVAKPKLVITDASKISEQFILPREQCINTVALTEYLKKERAADKAMIAAGKAVPKHGVRGAELVDEFILSTRLPEIVT